MDEEDDDKSGDAVRIATKVVVVGAMGGVLYKDKILWFSALRGPHASLPYHIIENFI